VILAHAANTITVITTIAFNFISFAMLVTPHIKSRFNPHTPATAKIRCYIITVLVMAHKKCGMIKNYNKKALFTNKVYLSA